MWLTWQCTPSQKSRWCLIWCYFQANQTFLSWGPLAQQENIGGVCLASTSCFLRSQAMAEVPFIVRCMMATIKNIFSTGEILVPFNALEMIMMTPFIPLPCFAPHYQSGRFLAGEQGGGSKGWHIHENQSGFQSRPDAAAGQGVGVLGWRQVPVRPFDGVQQGGDSCLRWGEGWVGRLIVIRFKNTFLQNQRKDCHCENCLEGLIRLMRKD